MRIKALLLSILSVIAAGVLNAREPIPALRDSNRFITVSLLVLSPSDEIYSVFGHCALRMECPSQQLDYCYTFETESGLVGAIKFFAGQSEAGFTAVPTKQFVQHYADEGRGIRQLTLNLTPHEKQELWRALDEDMTGGATHHFNLLSNNCMSESLLKVETVLEGESITFGRMPEPMSYVNGDGIRYLSRRSPWARFVFLIFIGTEADVSWDIGHKLSPELAEPVLSQAHITTLETGRQRPMLAGPARTLVHTQRVVQPSPLTPSVVFGTLLVLALALTLCERRWGLLQVSGWFDRVLFACQTLAGVFLLYVTLVSGLFGLHWNWYLIPFNPLPALVWLCCRKRSFYHRVYRIYAVVLLAFIPFSVIITSQADVAHLLLVGTMAVRCCNRTFKKQ